MQTQLETRQSRIVINGFLNLSDDEKRQVINHIVDHRKHTFAEQRADRSNRRKMFLKETEPHRPALSLL